MINQNIKHNIKLLFVWAIRNSFAQLCFRHLNKHNVIFIAYHGIKKNTEKLEAWTLVGESELHQQLLFLKENFDCLTIDEALLLTRKNINRPAVVVTFDDGYANNYEIALPILESYNIPATIYVTTRPVLERDLFWPDHIWIAAKHSQHTSLNLKEIDTALGCYDLSGTGMSWQNNILLLLEDIKRVPANNRTKIVNKIVNKLVDSPETHELHANAENNVFRPLTQQQLGLLAKHHLITIGAHSHCHNLLDQIPLEQAKDSIHQSKTILEEITGSRINHFAYPNGNYNTQLMHIVETLNFSSAVTFQPGFYKKGDNPYAINRFGIGADTSIDLFKTILTGIFEIKKKLLFIS